MNPILQFALIATAIFLIGGSLVEEIYVEREFKFKSWLDRLGR